MVSRCWVRKVGNTWKTSANARLFRASSPNVVSPAVISVRSAAGSRFSAAKVVPPFRTSETTALC